MTTGQGDSGASGASSDFLRDWEAVRHDTAIQFTPLKQPEPPKPPQWLQNILHWLGEVFAPVAKGIGWFFELIGLTGPVWPWIGGLVVLVIVAAVVWRFWPQRRRSKFGASAEEVAWTPEREVALGLLEEADRLASEGRFDEATHLLLQRSVGDIAEVQPGLLRPSSTAREIATLPVLSDGARSAFTTIAELVERSLFALRALDAGDWQAARAAYARFALSPPGTAA